METVNKEKFLSAIKPHLENIGRLNIPNVFIKEIDKLDLSVIRKKVNLPENAQIYAFFEKDTEFKGKEGILITDHGIYIHDANMQIDGSAKDKASLSYMEFAEYEAKVTKHLLKYTVTLKNKNLNSSKYSELQLWLIKNPVMDEAEEESLLEKIQAFFAILISISKETAHLFVSDKGHQNQETSDLLNSKYIEAFILGKDGDAKSDNDTCLYYKKAFVKYNINGKDQFAVHWSWVSFFFNWIHLLHRRLYIESLISFIIAVVVGGFVWPLTIAYWIASGMLNPFLLYRKYSGIVRSFKDGNLSEEKKIEILQNAGGTNKITSFIIGVIGLIVVIAIVVFVFKSCFGN